MKKKTALLLLHEIYGINQHMKHVICTFSSSTIDVVCPNLLYRSTSFHYDEESEAYLYFMKNVGFQQGKQQIEDMLTELRNNYTYVGVLGFSVGATIAWLCSEDSRIDFVIGCYGSRIRDYTNIVPKCPAFLLFPANETSFSVSALIESLQSKGHPFLKIKQLNGEHGFLDPFSTAYNAETASQGYEMIHSFLQNIIEK
ncbi:dienelactone hydrolase family protein [Bacillus sp. WLY-B-L8]|uniref:dienelactone hydrolase family protein n=1 Tax=Bacillus multifaciens TaxID=3068506 RepID=UPI0027410F95|nr:dienelactone hydrolase family protein [Bacillus sp. WLY-B-L8]MDP7981151.1 dienelactone hydrolase family protein [Bacillus sp. WLY-B-L8]